MSRLANAGAWLVGAFLPALAYWSAAVYVFDDFSRGYGRDTWFILQLYLAALAAVAGLVGYIIASLVRARPSAMTSVLLAGAVFGVCQVLLVLVMRRVFPDRDLVGKQLIMAVLLGAASVFVAARRAAD